jgi:hypothetical protein
MPGMVLLKAQVNGAGLANMGKVAAWLKVIPAFTTGVLLCLMKTKAVNPVAMKPMQANVIATIAWVSDHWMRSSGTLRHSAIYLSYSNNWNEFWKYTCFIFVWVPPIQAGVACGFVY